MVLESTLLKIMAGEDSQYIGETHASDGYTRGYLPQEPDLDPKMTVKEAVSEGVKNVVALLKEFEEINAKFAEEMTPEEMDKLITRQAKVQDRLDHANAWELRRSFELCYGSSKLSSKGSIN